MMITIILLSSPQIYKVITIITIYITKHTFNQANNALAEATAPTPTKYLSKIKEKFKRSLLYK